MKDKTSVRSHNQFTCPLSCLLLASHTSHNYVNLFAYVHSKFNIFLTGPSDSCEPSPRLSALYRRRFNASPGMKKAYDSAEGGQIRRQTDFRHANQSFLTIIRVHYLLPQLFLSLFFFTFIPFLAYFFSLLPSPSIMHFLSTFTTPNPAQTVPRAGGLHGFRRQFARRREPLAVDGRQPVLTGDLSCIFWNGYSKNRSVHVCFYLYVRFFIFFRDCSGLFYALANCQAKY